MGITPRKPGLTAEQLIPGISGPDVELMDDLISVVPESAGGDLVLWALDKVTWHSNSSLRDLQEAETLLDVHRQDESFVPLAKLHALRAAVAVRASGLRSRITANEQLALTSDHLILPRAEALLAVRQSNEFRTRSARVLGETTFSGAFAAYRQNALLAEIAGFAYRFTPEPDAETLQ